MRPALALLPLLLVPAAARAQLRHQTPEPLLAAHTLSLHNGTGSAALPDPAFHHLLQAFRQWHHYRLLADPRQADLVTTVSLSPDHRLHLLVVDRSTGFAVWNRSVRLDPTKEPVSNIDTSLHFLMLRLRRAVDHPPPEFHQSVP